MDGHSIFFELAGEMLDYCSDQHGGCVGCPAMRDCRQAWDEIVEAREGIFSMTDYEDVLQVTGQEPPWMRGRA
jgi:hypothetical protein